MRTQYFVKMRLMSPRSGNWWRRLHGVYGLKEYSHTLAAVGMQPSEINVTGFMFPRTKRQSSEMVMTDVDYSESDGRGCDDFFAG